MYFRQRMFGKVADTSAGFVQRIGRPPAKRSTVSPSADSRDKPRTLTEHPISDARPPPCPDSPGWRGTAGRLRKMCSRRVGNRKNASCTRGHRARWFPSMVAPRREPAPALAVHVRFSAAVRRRMAWSDRTSSMMRRGTPTPSNGSRIAGRAVEPVQPRPSFGDTHGRVESRPRRRRRSCPRAPRVGDRAGRARAPEVRLFGPARGGPALQERGIGPASPSPAHPRLSAAIARSERPRTRASSTATRRTARTATAVPFPAIVSPLGVSIARRF